MKSSKETLQIPPRNGLRLPPPPTPLNNEPSHQSHQAVSPNPAFSPKRSSQRNKHRSIVPDSNIPNFKRRTSRFGLSGLFNRSKPLASEEVQERLGVQWECDEFAETPMSPNTARFQKHGFQPLSPELRTLSETSSHAAPLRNRPSKTALRSTFRREVTSKSSTAWDPPPLFQVYPQAVRHATLRAPTLCAESILRLNAERNSSSNQRMESYTPEFNATKPPKEKKLKRPSTLDMLSKGEWTDKTFVLATSGYFLQYAGQGPSDRLPEKIMPLSKESAAFASDAIPGKPYVLQISQVSDEDGTLDTEASRSMFRSLGLRSQMKRSTSSFLLVFESPEELSAWMVAVRKEIQAMGGKEYRPDEFRKPVEVESIQQLHQRPSQRYLVQRNPDRFSPIPDPLPNFTFSDNGLSTESSMQAVDAPDPASINRQSMATQPSIDSRTTSNTTESINQIHLDRLRESPRQSYASTTGKTTSSSRDSSPGPSPVNLHADISQWAPNFTERRQTTSMNHGLVRCSVQQLTVPNKVRRESTISPPAPPLSHRLSKYAPQQQRTPSPAAPNFSVPTFSKRYSCSNNPPTSSCTTPKSQTLPVSLVHASPSSPVIDEEEEVIGGRASTLRELEHLQKPSPSLSSDLFPLTATPPRSAGSCGIPPSEGSRPFSRRFSSLEYSRGVSPLELVSQSPSPHPPPTTALPAIPGASLSSPSSIIKSPLSLMPPLPSAEEPRASSTTPTPRTALPTSRSAPRPPRMFIAPSPSPPSPPPTASPETESRRPNFSYPAPTKALPTIPDVKASSRAFVLPSPPRTPSHESTTLESAGDAVMPQGEPSVSVAPKTGALHQSSLIDNATTQAPTKINPTRALSLHRRVSMQVRSQPPVEDATSPRAALRTTFEFEPITPPPKECLPSPPRPTRDPPPPPPSEQRPQLGVGKSSPRIGREPPPVSVIPSPRSRISVISPATSYFDEAAPHPFIPPIKVSERKFRGSLDGPWNPAYGGLSQRNFPDFGAF